VTETPAPESSPPPAPGPATTNSPQGAPPPSHAGWAVVAVLFFWPLAFSAFTHSFNVYPLWAQGDVEGAKAASDRVRKLGQVSLWLFGILLLLFAIGYTAVMVAWISHGYEWHHHHWHHGMGDQDMMWRNH
jgi:interferon-induced transmembrane protein